GELFGLKIWELSNRMFDKLPVCALVDDAIFCAHGGIPHAAKTLQQIAAVNRKIREPEEESDIVWEILWSDPGKNASFTIINIHFDFYYSQHGRVSGHVRSLRNRAGSDGWLCVQHKAWNSIQVQRRRRHA